MSIGLVTSLLDQKPQIGAGKNLVPSASFPAKNLVPVCFPSTVMCSKKLSIELKSMHVNATFLKRYLCSVMIGWDNQVLNLVHGVILLITPMPDSTKVFRVPC
jgi:hypothetical protein